MSHSDLPGELVLCVLVVWGQCCGLGTSLWPGDSAVGRCPSPSALPAVPRAGSGPVSLTAVLGVSLVLDTLWMLQ